MNVLICYRTRRRIGAYLDGALGERVAGATAGHLATCLTCRREADSLRRLRALLQRALPSDEPDWSGFWPAVVRGIEDDRRRLPAHLRKGWWRTGWAFGGALAAALLVSLTIWQILPAPVSAEPPVIVKSADTGHPGGAVMVYSVPEQNVTVVWVFGLD